MENENTLVVRVMGKNMELNVYEERAELYKAMWSKFHTAYYSAIHSIYFREPSFEQTGFIKVRAQGSMFDFVTYRTSSSDTSEQTQAMKDKMHAALGEIEKRVREARGLPDNARLVTYF